MEKLLSCKIYPGQFSDEYIAQGNYYDSTSFSVIVTKNEVKIPNGKTPEIDKPVDGWLAVCLLKQDGNKLFVRLPQPTIENGVFVTVQTDKVKEGALVNDSLKP
jgi:hypothetical protein